MEKDMHVVGDGVIPTKVKYANNLYFISKANP